MSRPDLRWELAKAKFLDRPVIKDLAGTAQRILVRFGAYVRRDVRSALRRKGSKSQPHSRPGQPPFSPSGFLRKWTLFAYDAGEKSVTVGPHKLNVVYFKGDGQPAKGTVPEALEYGGTIKILEVLIRVPVGYERGRDARGRFARVTRFQDKWIRADLRSRRRIAELPQRMRAVTIEPRPYMEPAFRKNLTHLQRWRAAVT